MRVYMGVPTDYARRIIHQGFVGVPSTARDADAVAAVARVHPEAFPGGIAGPVSAEQLEAQERLLEEVPTRVEEHCEFRDQPPGGLILSRTAEVVTSEGDEFTAEDGNPLGEALLQGLAAGGTELTIGGGLVLADDPGDFIMSIDVPEDVLRQHQLEGDIGEEFGFRQFWLTPDEANSYRGTLAVYDSHDGEEVRPDLVGK